jgi:hypothetical protein
MDRFEQLYNYQFLKDDISPEISLDVTLLLFWLLFFLMVYCIHLISECVASKRGMFSEKLKGKGIVAYFEILSRLFSKPYGAGIIFFNFSTPCI